MLKTEYTPFSDLTEEVTLPKYALDFLLDKELNTNKNYKKED